MSKLHTSFIYPTTHQTTHTHYTKERKNGLIGRLAQLRTTQASKPLPSPHPSLFPKQRHPLPPPIRRAAAPRTSCSRSSALSRSISARSAPTSPTRPGVTPLLGQSPCLYCVMQIKSGPSIGTLLLITSTTTMIRR